MAHQLFKAIVCVLLSLDKHPTAPRFDFQDEDIVKVYYWAVISDRPTSWACQRVNWPMHLRKRPLPSPATMSRRLRSPSVVALLDALERRVVAPKEAGLFWIIDGKPLPIGGCSKDRQAGYGKAGYGKAAGGKAKGYKWHTLSGSDGSVAEWRVAPMNKDERVLAERMLKAAPAYVQGHVVADANYDSNKLHQVCDARGDLQLLTPRRRGPHKGHPKGTGHRRQTAGRLRCLERLENPYPLFAQRLFQDRNAIERNYGNLTNWGAVSTGCPPGFGHTGASVGGFKPKWSWAT